jgi:hypothetical protein
MGFLWVLLFYPEAVIAPLFSFWMKWHKKRCSSCPTQIHLYCARYAGVWRAINKSRLMLARARAAASKM